jgi:two-component system response regulator MprA
MNAIAPRILIVDDEPAVRKAVSIGLRREGYRVDEAADGRQALLRVKAAEYDLVVLDVLMPEFDGLTVCRELRRQRREVPVLVLSARDMVDDRVAGLDAGADDYLVKPFALTELRARVRALLRRPPLRDPGETLQVGDLKIDLNAGQAWRGDRELHFTAQEFALAECFLRNARLLLSPSVLYDRVWGYDFGGDLNPLRVCISGIRQKLEAAGEPRLIHTVRGLGYVLRER